MNCKGVIIEESLENKDVLKDVVILSTKIEGVTEEHKTPWLKQWTLHTVEIPEDRPASPDSRQASRGGGEEIAEKLSQALDSQHAWYADFRSDKFDYIIFRGKVFKVDRTKPEEYRKVTEYGLSLGIPDYQLDFSPHIKKWNRELYQCKECGLHYIEKEWAEKCETWCKEHKSCNLETTSHAEENKP